MEVLPVLGFLKEIGVGFKSAKSYPPAHPAMERVIDVTMSELLRLSNIYTTFSLYFLGQTVLFEDERYDIAKNTSVLGLLEALRKNEIHSLTFEPGVTKADVRNLYETISAPRLEVRQHGDAAAMLVSKGTRNIKINAVTFGISSDRTKVARESGTSKEPAVVIDELRALKLLLENGAGSSGSVDRRTKPPTPATSDGAALPGAGRKQGKNAGVDEIGATHVKKQGEPDRGVTIETKQKFNQILTALGNIAEDARRPYKEAVVRLLNALPSAQRAELFVDVELKPFVLQLLSTLDEDTLRRLLLNKIRGKHQDDLRKIVNALGAEKVAKVASSLQEEIPELHAYLSECGVRVGEFQDRLENTVSKDDLRATLKSYYSMLESPNPHVRQEGLKSLIRLATTFVEHRDFEQAKNIVLRITTALEQEAVIEVIAKTVGYLVKLYKLSSEAEQENLCSLLLEPFTKILGRDGLPVQFKRKVVRFFGSTNNPAVLPTLFSFLWDSGIYPDVRDAIVPFRKSAVAEALLTLKEAENPALRQKLVDILKRMGKDSIDMLFEHLDGAQWYLRRSIISILGDIGDQRVATDLTRYLDDTNDRVRLATVVAFAQLDYDDGLIKALDDASVEIRTEALRGLRRRISTEQVTSLLRLFKERGEAVHAELLKIIEEKNVPEALEPVVDYIRTLENRMDPIAQDLKEMAMAALLRFDTRKTKSYFEEFNHSKDETLAHLSKKALGRIRE